jgi:hypothetical protein
MQAHHAMMITELKARRQAIERELAQVQSQIDDIGHDVARLEGQIEILRQECRRAA